MQRQKSFRVKIEKLEFQIQFQLDLMKEIREDIKLVEDGDDSEKGRLKISLQNCKKERDKVYNEWKTVTEREEERRELVAEEYASQKYFLDLTIYMDDKMEKTASRNGC